MYYGCVSGEMERKTEIKQKERYECFDKKVNRNVLWR